MESPFEFYTNQILLLESSLKKIRKNFPWLYVSRLITFFLFIVFLALFFQFSFHFIYLAISLFSLVIFLITVKIDLNYVSRDKFLSNKLLLIQNELKFLDHQVKHFETGEEYNYLDIHLSADFDLFGKGSLFQYLNRSSTKAGRQRLAEGLCRSVSDKNSILQKQSAVKELAEKTEFMLSFRTHGMFISEKGNELANLERWLNQKKENNSFLRLSSMIIPTINLIWIALIISGIFYIISFLIPVFLSLFILNFKQQKVEEAHSKLDNSAKTFRKFTALIKLIEDESFSNNYLSEIKGHFFSEDTKASTSLTSLFKLLNKFDLRLNSLVSFFMNTLFLFDFHIYLQLEKWRLRHKDVILTWFNSLAEMDYLISLATFAYNNQGSVDWPVVQQDDEFIIQAQELGHPLLHPRLRICNDVSISGHPSVLIITGANMAGKSTFLRTISVNLILALNGAPVCAKSFLFTPCTIMSSIKIQDSLASNESYFYAELLRLKEIISHVQVNPKTLIILDEILRGTNSMDKHQGSIGLLERLIRLNAVVIIATHDLGIAELENKYPGIVSNNCFEVELKDDQLAFDYKLKKGISQKLNASFLMKKMEIIN